MARKSKRMETEESADATDNQAPLSVDQDANSESVMHVESVSHHQLSRCGGKLQETREGQGLSTGEVAKQLRLSNKQIEALEQDNFADLPEPTIVKGFIRNYAKLLKIPAEPLLDAYMVIVPEKKLHSLTLKPGINIKVSAQRKSNPGRYVLFGLIFLLALGMWLFYQNYVQKPNPINPTAELAETVAELLPEIVLPTPGQGDASPSVPLVLPVQAQASNETKPASMEAEAVVAAQASAQESAVEDSIVLKAASEIANLPVAAVIETVAEVGMHRLEFNASQETWVSVVNTSGRELYNKTLFAGNSDVVEFKPPFEVVVGNAHGATLSVDGNPVDLAPHTRTNVARVHLD